MGFTDVKYRNSVRDKDDEDRGRLVQNIEYEMVLRRALRKTKDSHQMSNFHRRESWRWDSRKGNGTGNQAAS